jgi:hypothetical protein
MRRSATSIQNSDNSDRNYRCPAVGGANGEREMIEYLGDGRCRGLSVGGWCRDERVDPNSGSWSRIASRYGVSVRLLRAGSRRL